MAVDQHPSRVREFASYLDGLLARLDQRGGWCAVFWQRDAEGMRACLDGREVPPWDVVEALLDDLAVAYGPEVAVPEKERVRPLHAEALLAYDTGVGGRDALGDRLDVMLREQRYAAERLAELDRRLASVATRQDADAIRVDLAWARDDHVRASARCAELRSRMAELDRRAAHGRMRAGRVRGAGEGPVLYTRSGGHGAESPVAPASRPGPDHLAPSPRPARHPQVSGAPPSTADAPAAARESAAPHDPPPAPRPAKERKRRRGGARFAGLADDDGAAPVVVPPETGPALPALPEPVATTDGAPRGARFAGAAAEPAEEPPDARADPPDAQARREIAGIVGTLLRLRGEGRTGEAHMLLVEAAHWPAARFPLLAAEMERAGLGADWATLLWEAASLPAGRLVGAADALVAAGRTADGEQMLRQGVARPPGEIGGSVLALTAEGRRREARALLDTYVRARSPEEAARSAEPDPQTLVPLLLEAARRVSDERHWDLVHALRVAGLTS
ncbi:hypothetical protein [Streptomyces cadmiisoli]|uniref:hypothetical protein n=1 Tax=Streptomyces cadmiisoli TaxID=2184053 RepID=UPI0036585931